MDKVYIDNTQYKEAIEFQVMVKVKLIVKRLQRSTQKSVQDYWCNKY